MMSSTFYDDFIECIPLLMAIFLLFIAPFLTDYAEKHARFSFFYWLVLLLFATSIFAIMPYSNQLNRYEAALKEDKPLYAASQEEENAYMQQHKEKEHELEIRKENYVLSLMQSGMSKEDAEDQTSDAFLEEDLKLSDDYIDGLNKLGHTPPRDELLTMIDAEKQKRTESIIKWDIIVAAIYCLGVYAYDKRKTQHRDSWR